ncbi:MAG: hypothetical protein KJ818_01605, partial [Candidatus Omnitrophica bacterium]|nr:hypothetical protein [Candidatus Omnitrophota bacterium]
MTNKNISLIIFIFFLSLYTLTMSGYIGNVDGEAMYNLTKNMLIKHDFSIEPGFIREVLGKVGIDGKFYAFYGVAQSLLAIPFYITGKFISEFFPFSTREFVTRLSVVYLNVIITALWVMLIFKFSLLLKFTKKVSLGLCFIFGLATMAWPYTKVFFSESSIGLFLTLALYYLIKYRSSRKKSDLFLSGAALGFTLMFKLVIVLVLPLCLVYLKLNSKNEGIKKLLIPFLIISFPVFCGLIFVGWYNFCRFGNPFETGYPNLFEPRVFFSGIYGFLLSPGKSIFIFSPILISSLFVLKDFYNRYKLEALLFAGIFLIFLFVFSFWSGWDGGVCWGPRYMVPSIPLFVFPLGMFFIKRSLSTKASKVVFTAFLIISVVVQLLPILVRYDIYINKMGWTLATDFSWSKFTIFGHARQITELDLKPFNASIVNLNFHETAFKEQFSRTIDIWYMYLLKFDSHKELALLALLPLISLFISGGL